jgi:hypothetical protein
VAQIIHEKRFDAVDHRAHARSMNLQSQLGTPHSVSFAIASSSLVLPMRRVSCVPPFGMALRVLMARFKMAAVNKV